jgi:hypothetical protein
MTTFQRASESAGGVVRLIVLVLLAVALVGGGVLVLAFAGGDAPQQEVRKEITLTPLSR